MSKSKIYAVRDTKIGFMSLFTASNDAVAIRLFSSAVNDEHTVMYDHPEDFSLCRLGELNEFDGVISAEEPLPAFVTSAISVRKEVS